MYRGREREEGREGGRERESKQESMLKCSYMYMYMAELLSHFHTHILHTAIPIQRQAGQVSHGSFKRVNRQRWSRKVESGDL